MRSALDNFVGVKDVGAQFSSCQDHQEHGDEGCFQQEDQEVAHIVPEQLHMARGKQQELLQWIAALRFFAFLDHRLSACTACTTGTVGAGRSVLQRLSHVRLVVWGELKARLGFFEKVGILLSWLQAIVDLGKLGLSKIGFGLLRWPKIG